MSDIKFKWEWNLNAIAHVISICIMLITAGIMYADLRHADQANAADISRLEGRMTAVESEARKIDKHDIRLSTVEKQAVTSAEAMKAVEQTLSVLSSDIRVVREILQRIEASGRK